MSEVADKRLVILAPQRMQLAEHVRHHWVVDAPEGTTVEDVLKPEFLAHYAASLKEHSRIDVVVETGEWFLELLVLRVGRGYVQTHLLAKHDLVAVDRSTLAATAKHEAKWKGPIKKWCAIRKADSQILQEGFEDRVAAEVWIANHERVTGA